MDIDALFDKVFSGNIDLSRINHLTIAAQFCRKINLIETVNRAVPGKRKLIRERRFKHLFGILSPEEVHST